jgi:hypothetical protein
VNAIFDRLWEQAMPEGMQPRTCQRARDLVTGLFNCAGKRTITGLLCGSGRQLTDWSAAYRLFSQQRLDPQLLLDASLRQAIEMLPDDGLIVAHLDDTLLRKTGRKIPGPGHSRYLYTRTHTCKPPQDSSCRAVGRLSQLPGRK